MTARVGIITFRHSTTSTLPVPRVWLGAEVVNHGMRTLTSGSTRSWCPAAFGVRGLSALRAIARSAPVMGEVVAAARARHASLGICNGFSGSLRSGPAAGR